MLYIIAQQFPFVFTEDSAIKKTSKVPHGPVCFVGIKWFWGFSFSWVGGLLLWVWVLKDDFLVILIRQ